jgi:predicted Fe-S protein YdhL (DUF1289 family)
MPPDIALRNAALLERVLNATSDSVPTPCISVCRIDAITGRCDGCLRSLNEISTWARSGPVAQRLLWREIFDRAGLDQPASLLHPQN